MTKMYGFYAVFTIFGYRGTYTLRHKIYQIELLKPKYVFLLLPVILLKLVREQIVKRISESKLHSYNNPPDPKIVRIWSHNNGFF